VVGQVNLHLSYYGFAGNPHSYLLAGTAMVQQLLVRIGDSNWLVGPRYTFLDARVSFDGSIPNAPGNFEARQRVAKGGVIFDYDSRDNTFYPTQGTFAEISPEISRPALGSSSSFETLSARAFRWFPVGTSWVVAFRADTGFSRGDTPFFAQPYVSLRGVPAAKYQDTNQLTGETEVRWYANSKWSLLAFGGLGKAYGCLHGFSEAPVAYGFGSGVRYLIDSKLGLTMGLDIARGPQQNAFYVQLGSAWR
jgi:outer membrane translocation and assembly module TamA